MDSRVADQVARVVAASRGRDRVLDAVKAVALLVVVVGHSLAWHVGADGRAGNVLDSDRRLVALTWVFQVLPLFFAAGAVSNLSSLQRRGSQDYLRARTERLLTPVLVYAAVWTVVLLPLTLFLPLAGAAGVFLAQLLWFAGVYLMVSAAAVWTARWTARPVPTLALWSLAIVLIDVLRLNGAPEAVGWANLLLVWGFLHQLGYHLPALRRAAAGPLVAAAFVAAAAAVLLAALGPYSSSLVTIGTDPELSNLAPPSVVLTLVGVAQVLLLAAIWDPITRMLAHDRVWVAVAVVGARGMGIYCGTSRWSQRLPDSHWQPAGPCRR